MRIRVRQLCEQVVTPLPLPVRTHEVALNWFIANYIIQWTDAFTPSAAARTQDIIDDITRDETAADRLVTTHILSPLCHIPKHHVAIGFENYTSPVQAGLSYGYTIKLDHDKRASLARISPKKGKEFGFHAEVVAAQARRIDWLDEGLQHFLQFGFPIILLTLLQCPGLCRHQHRFINTGACSRPT